MADDCWTIISLKEYCEALVADLVRQQQLQFDSIEKQIDRRVRGVEEIADERWTVARRVAERELAAAEKAQLKFEATVTARFSQSNEFRDSLSDLSATMATRRELEAAIQSLSAVDEAQAISIGDLRSRIDVGPEGLQNLRARADVREGHRQGVSASVSTILVVVGAAVGFIGLCITIAVLILHHDGGKTGAPASVSTHSVAGMVGGEIPSRAHLGTRLPSSPRPLRPSETPATEHNDV